MIHRLLLFAVILPGCVTFYQPQVSLQRPVAINPELGNFDGLHLLIRCVPGDYVETDEAQLLCRNLRPLFASQGAIVQVEVPNEKGVAHTEEGAAKPDLIIDLTARLLNSENSVMLWILSFGTLTLIPAITDFTFAQDVTLRDSRGFLLGSDTLQGRFVRYFGMGVLLVNWVLDLVVRPKSEKMTGNGFTEEFSKDFYGQLSQLAFQARMKSKVMHSFEVEPQPVSTPRGTR